MTPPHTELEGKELMTHCICCGEQLCTTWCDTHGVAACMTCGLPYTIFHYEGEGDQRKRVNKPATPAITEFGVTIAKAYWSEHKRRVFPGYYDIGFEPGDGGRTYSGATGEEMRLFSAWWIENKQRFPDPNPQPTEAA